MFHASRITHHASRITFHLSRNLDAGLLLAALLCLFIVQSLLQPGLPTLADLPIHLYRTVEYGRAWATGVIVPRWAPNLAYGYGYPLFVFAPPLPYWLGLTFQAVGFTTEAAFKNMMILTILLYALGMYLLARDLLHSVQAGLVAATAYAFAPFALREVLLYGGNIPQFLAIGLFPWTLWAMTRAARARSWGWTVLAALFYAAILLSHLFHALIFTPVAGLYGLLLLIDARAREQARDGARLLLRSSAPPLLRSSAPLLPCSPAPLLPLLTIPLGLLLSAFFWLPAFSERGFTRAQADIYLEKSPFFVRYPHWTELVAWIQPLDTRAANPYVPLTLGLVTLGLATLGLVVGLREGGRWLSRKTSYRQNLFEEGQILEEDQVDFGRPSPNPSHREGRKVESSSLPRGRSDDPLSLKGEGSKVESSSPWEEKSDNPLFLRARGRGEGYPTPYSLPPTPVYRLPSTVYPLFFATLAAGAIFMALPISRPVWETITLLQVAEFPWRMLGLANLGLAFLAGAALLLPPPRLRWPVTVACLFLQLVAVAPYLYPVIGFTRYDPISMAGQISYERNSQSIGTTTLGEYLPQTVDQPPTTSPLVEAFQANQLPERLDRRSLPAEATAILLEQTAVTHRYHLVSPAAFTLRLFHFVYPGWQATLDGRPVELKPETDSGLMLVDIPAGQHTLVVHFGETPGRLVALTLTGLTIVGLVVVGIGVRGQGSGVRGQGSGARDQLSSTFDPQSSTLHPPSSILHPPSSILHPLSSILHPLSSLLAAMLLIVLGAFWLKPLLRPVFTMTSPPGQALPAQHHTEVRFEKGVQLIGYGLDRRVTPAGGRLQVVLYWQTDAAPIQANLQPFVHLDRLDNFTTVAGATNYTPGDVTTESNMPTFHWDNSRYVRDEHELMLSPTTPPLAYAVRVGWLDPAQGRLLPLADGSGDTAQLTLVNVAPAPGQRFSLAQPLTVSFSNGQDTIQLRGFELDSLTQERLDFSLAWQSERAPQADYTVFAQLLDPARQRVAGFDQPPLAGAYPTSTWLPGQMILDPRFIPLAGVPPGEYQLVVGLYNSLAQQRLTTADGADFVELTLITLDEGSKLEH